MDFNLAEFKQELEKRKQYIDSCLQKYLTRSDAYPPVIHEAMHYAIFNGGKRLRPIMVLEGAKLAGGSQESAVPVACALEMIHSYSLVHDDLPAMDNDELRRGKPTCHIVFGEANAILTGDALLTGAFAVMTGSAGMPGVKLDNLIRVIKEIADAAGSQGMIGGQVIDLESEGQNIDYDTLKTLHSLKTGKLFQTALRCGGILNDINQQGLQAIDKYSSNFGLAFQITDDILDVTGSEELTGKPAGSDAKNAKTTYPGLFGLEKSRQLAVDCVQACIDSLQNFGSEADFLRQLAYYILQRQN
ncbi:MAG TPA: polyprenyl synthetase family protein [Gelria sp.]|jgi:geranylgeranyl diphosphate synthase type II|nr:polyprenyl synthetase family protein [Gelria sp.]